MGGQGVLPGGSGGGNGEMAGIEAQEAGGGQEAQEPLEGRYLQAIESVVSCGDPPYRVAEAPRRTLQWATLATARWGW